MNASEITPKDLPFHPAEARSVGRRGLLQAVGAAALMGTLAAGSARSASAAEEDGPHASLVEGAQKVLASGRTCLAHAIGLYRMGDTSMGSCSAAVVEATTICEALAGLASFDSRQLKPLARVALDLCKASEVECRKHADSHVQCRAHADACLACIAEIERLLA